jgi:hypothetical protein
MRSGDRAPLVRGAGPSSRSRVGLAALCASWPLVMGCATGSGDNDTFGSAISVGSNGNPNDTSAGASEGDEPDGSSGGSEEGATSMDPPPGSDTDDPPPGSEICNGVDDDGDGMVDEDQPSQTCGVGSCEVTEPSCMGGVPQACSPALPGGEVCNGLDDDCNGAVDDVGGTCSTSCGEGTIACSGTEQTCDAPPPSAETCNLLDDDCNGSYDDGVGGCRLSVHRSLHPATGEHFYTSSLEEAQCCGFVLEQADYYRLYSGPHAGLVPFHRCYTPGGFHFYTQDPACEGLMLEGVMGFIASAADTAGSMPLHRLYLPSNGDHFFTTSAAERDNAVSVYGYINEGVAGYVW